MFIDQKNEDLPTPKNNNKSKQNFSQLNQQNDEIHVFSKHKDISQDKETSNIDKVEDQEIQNKHQSENNKYNRQFEDLDKIDELMNNYTKQDQKIQQDQNNEFEELQNNINLSFESLKNEFMSQIQAQVQKDDLQQDKYNSTSNRNSVLERTEIALKNTQNFQQSYSISKQNPRQKYSSKKL